jgi:hypothetical protein
MKHLNRKSAPRVIGGTVSRKSDAATTPSYWNTKQDDVVIDVQKPGSRYKHFLRKRDILKFLNLIPNWEELSFGLDAIVLTTGGVDYDGIYDNNGVICLSAWEKNRDIGMNAEYFFGHKDLFDRLRIKSRKIQDGYYLEFSPEQIKAFQLLHVFLHELGHHVDRMRTKSQNQAARGERFAETFAFEHEKQMLIKYQDAFGIVF